MNEEQPQPKRIHNIIRMTGRSLLVILLIATSLKVFFIFRNLAGPGNDKTDTSLGMDNLKLVAQSELIGGSWIFSDKNELMNTGLTDQEGLDAIISQYQEKYVESKQHHNDETAKLSIPLKVFELLGDQSNKPTKIVNRVFVDPENKRAYLVLATKINEDNYWYLTTDDKPKKQLPSDSSDSSLRRYLPTWHVIARKIDDSGIDVLIWASDENQNDSEKSQILSHWDASGIEYVHNFPDFPERFDYTCKLSESSVRILGICEDQRVSDLIVIRQ